VRSSHRHLTRVLAAVVSAGLLAGCTVDKKKDTTAVGQGSIKKLDSLSGAKIRVSSKEFDEQLLLGQIAIIALQAAGADPVDKTDINGSNNVRRALTSGAVDLYWGYTGTDWISYLKHTQPIADPEKQFEAVQQADAKNGITWWDRAPANNTYAIAAKKSIIDKYHVKTLSDYAALAKKNPSAASICVESEFKNRDDGFPGLQKKYGFSLPGSNEHLLDTAVVYTALDKGDTCNFGEVYETDGRVSALHLTLLKDDKKFFPIYNPAISLRSSVAKKYPGIREVFKPIAAKLTTDTLASLNKKVSVDGQKPETVARDWLQKEGFISGG
jgi:osmoprotectant transport system substrate-binding protein